MKNSTIKTCKALLKRLLEPCSKCNEALRIKDIRLEGLSDWETCKMLFFTHMPCKSTMAAKIEKESL